MKKSIYRTQDVVIKHGVLYNRARCKKCNDVIESKYTHDFVTCSCGAISLDGGPAYQRCIGNKEDFDFMDDDK